MPNVEFFWGAGMTSILGRKVNALRRAKGLSLEDLAKATGSSKSYMWEVENKTVTRPSAEKLTRIAEALEVTSEYLLDEKRTEPAEAEADTAFYRKFQRLDAETKLKIKGILDILDSEE